ncbi:MAG: phosphocholine cytidylyltransferase family protein [Clostridiales bacterium]|jgi:choline kinase|nr:phosphocholine cytidylyltransferase family protein [Clostridiales bacterium]
MEKAILMAAGRGTRISRSIGEHSKCALDIGGMSLIRHTVSMLLRRGIETHVVVGYNKNAIYKALEGLQVRYHENAFYSVTNSLASLWWAKEELSGDSVILGNADVFWEDDVLDVLLCETRDCVMLCDSSRVDEGDYLFSVSGGKVTSYGKGKDCRNPNCEYVGLARIQGSFVQRCREKLEKMIECQRHGAWWEEMLYEMIPERPIWAYDIAGKFWAEIDFYEDYMRILDYLLVAT